MSTAWAKSGGTFPYGRAMALDSHCGQRRSQGGGLKGLKPPLSHHNIDVYFFNFSPILKSRWGALQNNLRHYHKA